MERKIFGTDGIRGKANRYPITPEMALRVGKATAQYLKEKNPGKEVKIVIGKDTRLSGYMLEAALESGIVACGGNALLVGPMPTPAIAHLTKSLKADAGIVLSASHNPAGDNGIKIFDADGFKLSDEEEIKIEQLIFAEEINGSKIGKAYRIDDAKGRYIEFAKASIRNHSLSGLKVVLDCANGAAYQVAPLIFTELGAEVIVLNNTPNGLNINLDCGALHPEVIQKAVKEHQADLGIALDGDADRIIVCDENSKVIDGDHIMAICALYFQEKGLLKKNTIVATVMSNLGFEKALNKAGLKVIRTKVGDRYVIEEVRKGDYAIGGEQSGHIIFSRYSTTGDGIISALQLMDIIKKKDKKFSELAGCMETFPQVLINIPIKEKKPLEEIALVAAKIKEGEEKLAKEGRILVRYSGTENLARVMVEGSDEALVKSVAGEIAEAIRKEIGA